MNLEKYEIMSITTLKKQCTTKDLNKLKIEEFDEQLRMVWNRHYTSFTIVMNDLNFNLFEERNEQGKC